MYLKSFPILLFSFFFLGNGLQDKYQENQVLSIPEIKEYAVEVRKEFRYLRTETSSKTEPIVNKFELLDYKITQLEDVILINEIEGQLYTTQSITYLNNKIDEIDSLFHELRLIV